MVTLWDTLNNLVVSYVSHLVPEVLSKATNGYAKSIDGDINVYITGICQVC